MPPSVHAEMGHLDQERKFLQSTNTKKKNNGPLIRQLKYRIKHIQDKERLNEIYSPLVQNEIDEDFFPKSDTPNTNAHEVCYAVIRDKDVTAYMDLTGRFPYRSSRGNEYILVRYHYDSNSILVEPL